MNRTFWDLQDSELIDLTKLLHRYCSDTPRIFKSRHAGGPVEVVHPESATITYRIVFLANGKINATLPDKETTVDVFAFVEKCRAFGLRY